MNRWYGKLLGLIAGWLLFRPIRCSAGCWACSSAMPSMPTGSSCARDNPYACSA
jgi:hypothetical protein